MGTAAIKVLHIDSESGWRGGQQQAAYLLQAMHRQGFRTGLVAPPNSALGHFSRDNSLTFFPLRMLGELDALAGYHVARLCRQHGFRILHLHSSHALAIGLWAKLFYSNLKLIAVRRVDFHIRRHWFSRFKYNSRRLDRIVCISQAIRQILIEDGIPTEKLITIYSGIDIHKFDHLTVPVDFKAKLGIPADHIVIGTIAAMAGHKDYPTLLRAARIVCDTLEHVTFCAVGDGSQREMIRRLQNEWGLTGRFILPGYRSDIGHFLKSFDIFVLASKQEGLGTSLLDAQAVGLPAVACHSGGIPEIIEHGQNGWLVPAQDEQALAAALIKLATAPELRAILGQRAQESVKKFDIKYTIEQNLQLYEDLIRE